MKIYSDTLTRDDLYAALPADVMIADIREIRTRKRARGWELHLEGFGARHTRRRNSGHYGAVEVDAIDHYGYAATWDDHGIWMAALYEIDPNAAIAWYRNRDHFYEATEQSAQWRQRSQFRTIQENGQAPWLRVMAGSGGDA